MTILTVHKLNGQLDRSQIDWLTCCCTSNVCVCAFGCNSGVQIVLDFAPFPNFYRPMFESLPRALAAREAHIGSFIL